MNSNQLLAHEIQAPLTSLELQLRSLVEDDPENDRLARCLEAIDELQSLVTHFLELDAPVKNDVLTLGPVLERVERRFRPIAAAKRVQLEIDATSAVRACGDARATERILANLVDNALKFSDVEGNVGVRVSPVDHGVEIEVRDQGIGIEPDARRRVFEPFFRADRERPGAGLGLAISKRLAEAQNGNLRFDSELGRGSSFVLTLSAT